MNTTTQQDTDSASYTGAEFVPSNQEAIGEVPSRSINVVRPVFIEGTHYASLSAAARILNQPLNRLYHRLVSQLPRWKDYYYTDGKPVPVFVQRARKRADLWVTYVFEHLPSGKKYVGITCNFPQRKSGHLHRLRQGNHPSFLMQELYNEDSNLDHWHWGIFVMPGKQHALDCEQSWIDQFASEGKLLNSSLNGRSPISHVMDRPEVQEKIRQHRESLDPSIRFRRSQAAKKGLANRWSQEGAREKIQGGGNPFAREVVINGVTYGSVIGAAAELGVNEKTIRNRIAKGYSGYSYA